MKNGGNKPLNVIVLSVTFKIYEQMEKLFTKEDTFQKTRLGVIYSDDSLEFTNVCKDLSVKSR